MRTMSTLYQSVLSLFSLILPAIVYCQTNEQPLCLGRSCYPATGNLLVGREDNLQASSTCGLRYPNKYCVVGDVREGTKCFRCDTRYPWSESNRGSHNITNIVTTFSRDRLRRWWQAENGNEEVFIQLDLDAEFHFTHLIITFKTFRPKSMYIERSFDFGKSWLPYRYFAEDCKKSFPDVPMGPVKSLKSPTICEEKYSNVLPASGGEVVFKVLPPHMKIDDPYSQEVQDLLKLTNLRVIFKELHTLGDDLLDQSYDINEKYYYSIYDMVVRGSCSCYGHASRCVPSKNEDWGVENMVHSKCECTHNTKGKNCDQCADFYNDRPWVPARGKETGECKKCECHNHATSCHFDPAVYHSRGNVSGGVCDNCMHNTDGLNCELCKSHFFQDPALDLRNPLICKPCDCDPVGTENNGECDMRNDPDNGLVAGRCKCKENVGGARCERCIAGYWDLSADGCRECECNLLGTYDNQGCDQFNGECTCKRFVTGRNCDQCLAGYWGLSKEDEGCQPCGCDIGGSYDNDCDFVSGQCNCKPGITGRACDQATPGYFITDLDFLRYEAELATGTGNSRVVIREKVDGYPVTWTGPGFMRVYEGDSIEFLVDDIPYSMNYDIIIRYETQMPDGWDDVRVIITRPGAPDPDGPCGNLRPEDDNPGAPLSSSTRHHIVTPQICLEQGKTYYIRLEFHQYQVPDDTPDANILIDSIALLPVYTEAPIRTDGDPISPGDMIYCNNFEFDINNLQDIPEICRKFMFSIGAAIQNQALRCDCDGTGSESVICDSYGGQCKCKPNVSGRRCDICSPGTYGFGVHGCLPCNCNAQGARDNFCDILTGNCLCLADISGRTCDRCVRGMFNFPRCERCQCNGHADECEDRTGDCLACDDFTTGPACEACIDGYYGDPTLGSAIPCRECMCPGGDGSGFQHADTCSLDPRTKDMICDCPDQFAGDMCERCAMNHFGDPMVANGTCTSCLETCNYNIDMSVPDSCDPVDGTCTQCQYDTDGDNCELCANGFYGNAVEHTCVACNCNWLGADRSASEPCNRSTGQCPCLPNVVGEDCGQCAADHWKLASGEGCEACDCDDEGSTDTQCNEFDGQCQCVEGRGGRRCDQCIPLHWGNPVEECFACECNVNGSKTLQCDPENGQCECMEGITGQKCDRCDRGTTGMLPNCVPCGECFDNWDNIIQELKNQTDVLLAQVNVTKSEGAVGVYDDQFMAMEKKLDEVRKIIDGFNQSKVDMAVISLSIDDIKRLLTDARDDIVRLTEDFRQTHSDIAETGNNLSVLKAEIQALIDAADRQKINVEDIIKEDIIGAYKTIQANEKISRDALSNADDTKDIVLEAESLQTDTLQHLADSEEAYLNSSLENLAALNESAHQLDMLRDAALTDVNKQVCDLKSPFDEGQFCDAACGGGGCDKCGEGDSCTEGAQGKLTSAVKVTERAKMAAGNKSEEALTKLDEMNEAADAAEETKKTAGEAHMEAEELRDSVRKAGYDMEEILTRIGNLLSEDKATPEQVMQVADEVLALTLPEGQQAEIEAIARQINETIQNLTNIDQILNDTAADLLTSEALKQRAHNASMAANDILNQVNDLNKKLSDAQNAQNDSTNAIKKANEDIADTRQSLKQIGDVMTAAVKKAQELMLLVEQLFARAKEVGSKNIENEINLENARKHAVQTGIHAETASELAMEIDIAYKGKSEEVMTKFNASNSAHQRAERLLTRASNLASSLSTNYKSLQLMNTELSDNEQVMQDLQKEIDRLTAQVNQHIESLTRIENYHNKCELTESTLR